MLLCNLYGAKLNEKVGYDDMQVARNCRQLIKVLVAAICGDVDFDKTLVERYLNTLFVIIKSPTA